MEILIAIIILAVLGLLCGVMLALAAKYMAVKENAKEKEIRAHLPGANCGACGYAGCDSYAKALAEGECTKTNLCIPGADAVAKSISEVIGAEFEDVIERVATVHCIGDCRSTPMVANYVGIDTCAAASKLYGGVGACVYGCLGLGDCAKVCPSGAICIEDGIARVDTRKCTGCGLCTKVCPHSLIDCIADVERVVVTCSNRSKGMEAKKVCNNACIACHKCEKTCPTGAIKVVDDLARIDYDICIKCDACASVCPTGCIMLADNSGIHRFLPPEKVEQIDYNN